MAVQAQLNLPDSPVAQHEKTALDQIGLFHAKPKTGVPWIVIEAELPKESGIWQWNPKLELPERKAVTPEKETK
jgi:hypothetical protein